MWFRRLIRNLFPPPRQPWRWGSIVVPLAILTLFVGVCVGLSVAERVLFARPAMFGFLAFAPWLWWLHAAGFSGLGRVRGEVSLAVRLLLLGLFVVALAEPRAVRSSDRLSVVYALDISDSIGDDTVDKALAFVASTVQKKPPSDEAGLVVFGRSAAVERPPREGFPFDEATISLNTQIERDSTNLEQALSLSAAMLPEQNLGRIVLISDGASTDGSLPRALDELKSRGVAVDVVPVQYDPEHEVWLERLELPRHVKLGETYEASVILSSLKAGRGKLVLRENGKILSEDEVSWQPGKNRYVVAIRLRDPGYYEYTATIEPAAGEDHVAQNNTVVDYLFVEGEGRILVVTSPEGEPRDWQPLVKALQEGKRLVTVQTAYDFPRDALSLMPYDAVFFVNVPADAFDAVQLRAVKDAVFDLGIGYLMVGGQHSFGPGGYQRTPVEETLPVSMDVTNKKILPKGALVIVLHTCEFPEGNTWAKRITKQAIKVLSAQDEVGVAAFTFGGGGGFGDTWIFPLTPASKYESLVPKIEAAEVGDMPAFGPSMQMGLDALMKSDAAAKHMIVISDGDPQPPSPTLLKDFSDKKVSVSTVSIYPHGNIEIQTLSSIANLTGGRYYATNDPSQLPAIFIKEAKTLRRNMIVNKTVNPEIGFDSSILKGIDGVPPLKGYVLTSLKEQLVKEVLRVPESEDQIDPILAVWKFGLGTAAAFTSDLSPNWGAEWVDWEKYQAFVTQLATEVARVRKEGHLRISTETMGNQGTIVVEDYHPEEAFLELRAVVSGPREQTATVPLKQVAPRRYQGALPLWGRGRYQVLASPVSGGRKDERAIGGFIVPYSPEYVRFRSNPIVLNEIAEKSGGKLLNSESTSEDVFQSRRQRRTSSRPVFDWFLFALAFLVPLDVAVRRVQIDWALIKGWLGLGRRTASTATMDSLLKKKREVGAELESRREERPLAARPVAPPPRPTSSTPPAPTVGGPTTKPAATGEQPGASSQPPSDQPTSTTSRLLDAKRRRKTTGEGET